MATFNIFKECLSNHSLKPSLSTLYQYEISPPPTTTMTKHCTMIMVVITIAVTTPNLTTKLEEAEIFPVS